MAGKGGGAWKVAYADFVTAMMAFFMVMWITSQGKEVQESVSDYFRDPFGVSQHGRPVSGIGPPGSKVSGIYHSGLGPGRGKAPGKLDAQSSRRGRINDAMRLQVGRNIDDSSVGMVVLFPTDSAQLDADAKEQLRQLAPQLAGKANRIEIRGHASRNPLPSGSPYHDPWQLSYARCQATMQFLEDHGIPPQRFRLSQSADHEPNQHGAEFSAQDLHSRVEVQLLGEFIQQFPGNNESTGLPLHDLQDSREAH